MKDRLAGSAKEFRRERQKERRPGAGGHYNPIATNLVAIFQYNSRHAAIAFVKLGELAGTQLNPGAFRLVNQFSHHALALRVPRFEIDKTIAKSLRVPCRES